MKAKLSAHAEVYSPLSNPYAPVCGFAGVPPHGYRRLTIGLAAALIFCFAGACRSTRSGQDNAGAEVSAWQARPLVIDGSDDDWNLPLPGYDKKEQVSYSMTNDKDNVYILLSAKTREEQQKNYPRRHDSMDQHAGRKEQC